MDNHELSRAGFAMGKLRIHETDISNEGHSWWGCLSYALRNIHQHLCLYLLDARSMAQDELQRFLQIVPNVFSGGSGKRMGEVGNY